MVASEDLHGSELKQYDNMKVIMYFTKCNSIPSLFLQPFGPVNGVTDGDTMTVILDITSSNTMTGSGRYDWWYH